jgi:hypothetical protein
MRDFLILRPSARVVVLAAVLAATLGEAAEFAARAGPRAPVRITTHVVVTSDDKSIANLRPDQLRVAVDGRDVPVLSVAAAGPVAVVVIFDLTTSVNMNWQWRRGELNSAGKRLVDRLRPGDRGRIGAIGTTLLVNPRFTADKATLETALQRALNRPDDEIQGPSPIWDALWETIEALGQEQGRRAIVLVSDGRATGNVRGLDEVVAQANAYDVAIGVINEDQHTSALSTGSPAPLLQRLAARTGGGYTEDTSTRVSGKSRALMERLLVEFQGSWAVTFEVEADGRMHELNVTTANSRLRARARLAFRAQ